jgi:hypothetical protein
MNKLQKSAWLNLAFVTAVVIFCGIVFSVMVFLKAPGSVIGLVSFMISGAVFALISFMIFRKKGIEAKFDERELKINLKAKLWSLGVLMFFLAYVCIGPFLFLGAKAQVPVYVLPMLFLATLFIAQFVHSAVILIRCMLEDEDAE